MRKWPRLGRSARGRTVRVTGRAERSAAALAVDGAGVALTPLQYNLLRHLLSQRERVIDRDELVQAVWARAFVGSNVVDAAVRSLRKKLGPHAGAIETVKGFGYRYRG